MIPEFVAAWTARKDAVRATLAAKHPEGYIDIVRAVVSILAADAPDPEYDAPDPERIHEIDDGAWQGTLLYVIGASGYQPSRYWWVKVSYGSCSGCDTLQSIRNFPDDSPDDTPTPQEVEDYMALALHIVQGLHACDDGPDQ